jgi:hypothetical protein
MADENEVSLKRWKLDRIDKYIQTVLEELRGTKEYYVTSYTEDYPKTFQRKRNQILAGIGFVVTLLVSIRDFSQVTPFKDLILLIVIITLSSGIGVFLIYTELIRKSSKIINEIDLACVGIMSDLYRLKTFVDKTAVNLEPVGIQQLNAIYYVVQISVYNRIELCEVLKDASGEYIFRREKSDIIDAIKVFEGILHQKGYNTYRKYEKQIHQEKEFLEDILSLMNPIIQRYQQGTTW